MRGEVWQQVSEDQLMSSVNPNARGSLADLEESHWDFVSLARIRGEVLFPVGKPKFSSGLKPT